MTDAAADSMILDMGRIHLELSAGNVTAKINASCLLDVILSRRTVARRLKEAGARTVRPIRDDLSELHKQHRVKLAERTRQDLANDPNFLRTIIFSDEVRFNLEGPLKKVFICACKFFPMLYNSCN